MNDSDLCRCGHTRGAHGPHGCVDWDGKAKRRCTCEQFVVASAPVPPSGAACVAGGQPTLEQCENVAAALGFPLLPESLRPPYYYESLLNLHKLVVRTLNGDREAEQRLARLRQAFVSPA